MTLVDYLNAGSAYARSPGVMIDPSPDCAAAGFAMADIQAKRDTLATVEDRCVISRLQREFCDRVLALMP